MLMPTHGVSARRGVEKSGGRSLAGTSLAAETSQFCHCTDVYFWAMQRSARVFYTPWRSLQGFWKVSTRHAGVRAPHPPPGKCEVIPERGQAMPGFSIG